MELVKVFVPMIINALMVSSVSLENMERLYQEWSKSTSTFKTIGDSVMMLVGEVKCQQLTEDQEAVLQRKLVESAKVHVPLTMTAWVT